MTQLALFSAGSFTEHMDQHLLIGMYAPLGSALGAPVTLVLGFLALGLVGALIMRQFSKPR